MAIYQCYDWLKAQKAHKVDLILIRNEHVDTIVPWSAYISKIIIHMRGGHAKYDLDEAKIFIGY